MGGFYLGNTKLEGLYLGDIPINDAATSSLDLLQQLNPYIYYRTWTGRIDDSIGGSTDSIRDEVNTSISASGNAFWNTGNVVYSSSAFLRVYDYDTLVQHTSSLEYDITPLTGSFSAVFTEVTMSWNPIATSQRNAVLGVGGLALSFGVVGSGETPPQLNTLYFGDINNDILVTSGSVVSASYLIVNYDDEAGVIKYYKDSITPFYEATASSPIISSATASLQRWQISNQGSATGVGVIGPEIWFKENLYTTSSLSDKQIEIVDYYWRTFY